MIQHLPCFPSLETEFLGCLFNRTAQIHDLLEVQGRSCKQKCHTGVTQFVTLAEYDLQGRLLLKLHFERKNFPPLSAHLTFNTRFLFPCFQQSDTGYSCLSPCKLLSILALQQPNMSLSHNRGRCCIAALSSGKLHSHFLQPLTAVNATGFQIPVVFPYQHKCAHQAKGTILVQHCFYSAGPT